MDYGMNYGVNNKKIVLPDLSKSTPTEKPENQNEPPQIEKHFDPTEYIGRSMVKLTNGEEKLAEVNQIRQELNEYTQNVNKEISKIVKLSNDKGFHNLNISGISLGEIKILLLNEKIDENLLLSKLKTLSYLLENTDYDEETITNISSNATTQNENAIKEFVQDKDLPIERFLQLVGLLNDDNKDIVKDFMQDDKINLQTVSWIDNLNEDNCDVIKTLSKRDDIDLQDFVYICGHTNKHNKDIVSKMINNPDINIKNNISSTVIEMSLGAEFNKEQYEMKKQFLNELLDSPDFNVKEMNGYTISKILSRLNETNYDISKTIAFKNKQCIYGVDKFLSAITPENKDKAVLITQNAPKEFYYDKKFLSEYNVDLDDFLKTIEPFKDNPQDYEAMFYAYPNIESRDFEEIKKTISSDELSPQDIAVSINATNLRSFDDAKKLVARLNNTAEMTPKEKNNFLNSLLSDNEKVNDYMINLLKSPDMNAHTVTDISNAYHYMSYNSDDDNIDEEAKLELLNDFVENKDIPKENLADIIKAVKFDNSEYANPQNNNVKLIKELVKNPNVDKNNIANIATVLSDKDIEFANYITSKKKVPFSMYKNLRPVLSETPENKELVNKKRQVFETLLETVSEEDNNYNACKKLSEILYIKNIDELDNIIAKKDIDLIHKFTNYKTLSNYDSVINEINELCKDENVDNKVINGVVDILSEEGSFYSNTYFSNKELIKNLLQNDIKPKDTCDLIDYVSADTLKKITEQIPELKEKYGFEKLSSNMCSTDDEYIKLSDNKGNVYVFNKDSKLISINTSNSVLNFEEGTKITSNSYKTQDIHMATVGEQMDTPYYTELIINRSNGQPVSREILTESFIPGEYEIYEVLPDGKRYNIGLAEYDKNGGKHVEKTLTSLNGSKTNYVYTDDKDGNRFIYYDIKDNEGNTLFQTEKTFKVLSENHFQSSKNGEYYDIEIKDDKIITTKLNSNKEKTDEAVEYKIAEFTDKDYENIYNNDNEDETYKTLKNIGKKVVDKRLLPLLKQLSGDEWFALDKQTDYFIGKYPTKMNAASCENIIIVSDEINDANFIATIEHEIGHQKFDKLKLNEDEELKKIYLEEREKFMSSFPKENISSISYFLDDNDNDWRGMNEATAETNQLINVPQTFTAIQDRTIILQQFFPKTIAYVANKYNNY